MSDFFDVQLGLARNEMDHPRRAAIKDRVFDLKLRLDERTRKLDQAAAELPRQRILVVGVEVPSRGDALRGITQLLAASRHDVAISTVPMQPKGKFENVNDAIAACARGIQDFDWLMITDDDVGLPPRFTDRFIAAASLTSLVVSQPAHKFESFTSYDLTRRRFGTQVRQTRFVEIGPLTLIHASAFDHLVPFPASRWAWGLDLVWAEVCQRNGWKMGIVDATPIRHLRPVAESYSSNAAIEEARSLLVDHEVILSRGDLLSEGTEIFNR